ncbi:MAG: hypothetical protein JNJ44_11005 [Zoogloeaceae bacterium]|nr:hypothetical protein [Zoogloeaceae bacterium]
MSGFLQVNGQTFLSTQRLRENSELARTTIPNPLALPLGSAPMKCFVCGEGQGMRTDRGGL